MALITRANLAGLIPETVSREIVQGAIAESAILRMAKRLPNMTSKQQVINVLDSLPTAYFVDGEVGDVGDGKGVKKTTNLAWDKKRIYAEEVAVIVPIPQAALDDADYDIWGEVKPRLTEAFGKVIDAAILYGTNKPSTWREGLVPSAFAKGAGIVPGIGSNDIYDDIMGVGGLIAKVEESGFNVSGIMAAIQLKAKLRGLRDDNGQPIFVTDMQGATPYAIDGAETYFPLNGAFDPTTSLAIAGDWQQLVYAIRQDMEFKIFDSGVIQDPTDGSIAYNLIQNDMVALRATMRLGWEIPNPTLALGAQNAFPFAVYGFGEVDSVTVSPATKTVLVGGTQQFTAEVDGDGAISQVVVWTISGAAKSGTTISADGLLTIDAAETAESITVTATSAQDSEVYGTATVTVDAGE